MPENYKQFISYKTVGPEILFIFIYESKINTSQRLTLEPKWRIYGSILQKGSNQVVDLFLIYQTSIQNITFESAHCGHFYDGGGFFCYINFANLRDGFIKVTFLSNGKIIEIKKDTDFDTDNISGFYFFTLKFGGLIPMKLKNVDYGRNINMNLIGSDK